MVYLIGTGFLGLRQIAQNLSLHRISRTHSPRRFRAKPGSQSHVSVQKSETHISCTSLRMCLQVRSSQLCVHLYCSWFSSLHLHDCVHESASTQMPHLLRKYPSSQSQWSVSQIIGHIRSVALFSSIMAFAHVLGLHGLKQSTIFSWSPQSSAKEKIK